MSTALRLLQNWNKIFQYDFTNGVGSQVQQRMGILTDFVGNLAELSALDFSRDTDERATEGVLRRREQHLLLDLRVIRSPDGQDEL